MKPFQKLSLVFLLVFSLCLTESALGRGFGGGRGGGGGGRGGASRGGVSRGGGGGRSMPSRSVSRSAPSRSRAMPSPSINRSGGGRSISSGARGGGPVTIGGSRAGNAPINRSNRPNVTTPGGRNISTGAISNRLPGNTTRPAIRPGTGTGNRPGTGLGNRPGSGTGNRPGTGIGNRPGTGPGNRPGPGTGNRPGTGIGNRPGTGPGNRPGAGPGNRPGTGIGNRPGTGPGNRPGRGPGFATDGGFSRYSGGVRVRPGNRPVVRHNTRPISRTARVSHARNVRRSFYRGYAGYRNWFRPNWYVRHPYAWRAPRWVGVSLWTAATWGTLNTWWGWGTADPYYYDYGTTVFYEGDTVYYDSQPIATAQEYYVQAGQIASQGIVEVPENEQWQSLGVWAMVQGEETQANKIVQIAVNQAGIIRGNFYDALTETTLPIQGSVDQETQRAAWIVGENEEVVYETGIYNLTKEETEMLIHFGQDNTQQWSLVRLEDPGGTVTQ